MEMTLTRCLAEIKKLEEELKTGVPVVARVAAKKTNRVEGVMQTVDEFTATSQSDFDKYLAKTERLIRLKAARNKANVETVVRVGGKDVSMDEAISRKALLPTLQAAILQIKKNINTVEQAVQKSEVEVQNAIDKNVNAASTSGTPLLTEQIDVLRTMYETSLGKVLVVGTNIKTALKTLEDDLKAFELEIDYVLSEANAVTKVTV